MPLAPTLLKFRSIAVGLGACAISGQVPVASNPDLAILTPARAALSTPASNYFPTIITQSGPTASPTTASAQILGLVPSQLRTLVITPSLPDATPEENDLTPTIIWGGITAPGVGLLTASGQIPAQVRDESDYAFPAESSAPAAIAGLVPTVSISAAEEWTKSPRQAPLSMVELAPTMLGELTFTVEAPSEFATIAGLVPTFRTHRAWQTIELAGDAVWTDTEVAS